MKVLAIETTCDETAAAVVETYGKGVGVLSSVVASSALMHQKYGGIVPEVAAREQIKSIVPVIFEAMKDISKDDIESLAVSYGPGLIGSLLVGVETAKVLATTWNKPIIKVNHMAGHVAANWIVEDKETKVPELPAVGLIVSGGHTDLVLMKSFNDWSLIGGTRDDAVGEAYDKAARLLGLPYPGGPSIQNAIEQIKDSNEKKFTLPRPMIHENNLEMSFSGLKAALAKISSYETRTQNELSLMAKEFNDAVVEVLVSKTLSAMEQYQVKTVLLAGGVAANSRLRAAFGEKIEKDRLFVPNLKYCGDNAAMVGAAAIFRPDKVSPADLSPNPSLMSV